MSSYKITVQNREGVGSNRVNKLRAQNLIPAVIYKKVKRQTVYKLMKENSN